MSNDGLRKRVRIDRCNKNNTSSRKRLQSKRRATTLAEFLLEQLSRFDPLTEDKRERRYRDTAKETRKRTRVKEGLKQMNVEKVDRSANGRGE